MKCLSALSFLVAASLCHYASSSTSSPCSPLPYEFYWNVAEKDPSGIDLSQYYIFTANYTQTGSGCSNPGCVPWTQGVFPTISESGNIVNGGVPQNANLTEHLQSLARGVAQWIPDPDWAGNAVLDFEEWTTVWELNYGGGDWHSIRYPEYSLKLEEEEHPDWNLTQIYLQAKKDFNTSAVAFFAETLKTLTGLRPKVKWGFYGLPMNFLGPCEGSGASTECGYNSDIGDIYRAFSDEQRLIWEASTALFPSIYFPPFVPANENAAYVRSVINETMRNAAGRIPVYGFHWNYYHNATTLLSPEDLQSGLLGPYDVGAQGVVIWGSSTELSNSTFLTYVKEKVGPLTQKFIEDMCECSMMHCSGHGRCMPSTSTNCQCYKGYSGSKCENNTN